MKEFYSNGKLLLTGEYAVLDGGLALALPTKYGQTLSVRKIDAPKLVWESRDAEGKLWFDYAFDLKKFSLDAKVSPTTKVLPQSGGEPNPDLGAKANVFKKDDNGVMPGNNRIAQTLLTMLLEAKKLNPNFLVNDHGYLVGTRLDFPRDWGLGSSSTLVNNIAQWAGVDPYQLLWNAFSGSGYDIACARHDRPILYQRDTGKNFQNPDFEPEGMQVDNRPDHNGRSKKSDTDQARLASDPNEGFEQWGIEKPRRPPNRLAYVKEVAFDPPFHDHLFFVHLNKKQDSREGIARYRKMDADKTGLVRKVSEITLRTVSCESLSDFEALMVEHEALISRILQLPPIKESLFPDFGGAVKSLGAWGGDFVLATGGEETRKYFNKSGYHTILPYRKMVLDLKGV